LSALLVRIAILLVAAGLLTLLAVLTALLLLLAIAIMVGLLRFLALLILAVLILVGHRPSPAKCRDMPSSRGIRPTGAPVDSSPAAAVRPAVTFAARLLIGPLNHSIHLIRFL
jgi:hypothetical protein